MADEKGLAVLVKVGDAATSATTYTVLEGQTDGSLNGSTNVADSTAKDNDGWQTSVATTRSGTVQVSGNVRDTAPNFDKLKAAWAGGTTYDCQIVYDAAGHGWVGNFYVTELQISGAANDLAKYSITLTPAAALSEISVA